MILSPARDGNGWILRSEIDDKGLWFESREAAFRWAKGMGLTVTMEKKK